MNSYVWFDNHWEKNKNRCLLLVSRDSRECKINTEAVHDGLTTDMQNGTVG